MPSSHDPVRSSVEEAGRSSSRRGLWHRLLRSLGAGLGLAAASVPTFAQAPVQPIPQHWISYANLAGNQLQAALSDPANATVVLLHAWMQDRMLKERQPAPAPPLVVRLWVAPGGQVERATFTPLGDAQADDYLRTLLMAQSISEPPPRDMRQPMVLQLTLTFVTPTAN